MACQLLKQTTATTNYLGETVFGNRKCLVEQGDILTTSPFGTRRACSFYSASKPCPTLHFHHSSPIYRTNSSGQACIYSQSDQRGIKTCDQIRQILMDCGFSWFHRNINNRVTVILSVASASTHSSHIQRGRMEITRLVSIT